MYGVKHASQNIASGQRRRKYRDMETGKKSNQTTCLKGTNMMTKVERQKQTPLVLRASQAYQTHNTLDLKRQTKVFCNISGIKIPASFRYAFLSDS
jgi:hypothetical protein